MSASTRDAVRTATQFSVFLVNKPGVLARICQQLAAGKVNILALTMMDSTEHGVLRFVAENPEAARKALGQLDAPHTEASVLTTELPNRPGALADVFQRLAASRIAIDYAYCTAGAANGRSVAVLRVNDIRRAEKVLAERKPQRRERLPARKPAAVRRG
jgi:hypothetical protein